MDTDKLERLVFGIPKISVAIGGEERQTYHLATRGLLPGVFKMGGHWVMLPSAYAEGVRARASAFSAKTATAA